MTRITRFQLGFPEYLIPMIDRKILLADTTAESKCLTTERTEAVVFSKAARNQRNTRAY